MSRYIDLDQIEFLKVDGNKEFNHGVDCCINILLEAEPIKAIPLDKVKKAREEIEKLDLNDYGDNLYQFQAKCTEILDKLIESEE